jgi:hypothetical protein
MFHTEIESNITQNPTIHRSGNENCVVQLAHNK